MLQSPCIVTIQEKCRLCIFPSRKVEEYIVCLHRNLAFNAARNISGQFRLIEQKKSIHSVSHNVQDGKSFPSVYSTNTAT